MARGISLLETVLAATLVAFIMIFVLNIFPDSLLAVRRSEQEVQADQWSCSLIEREAARPFDELVKDSLYAPAPLVVGATNFTAEVRCFAVPGTRFDLLIGVRVTVKWEHRQRLHVLSEECLLPYVGH